MGRLRAHPSGPRRPWYRHCRLAHVEEDPADGRHPGLLHGVAGPHHDEGQLREGRLRRADEVVRLPDARPVAGDQVLQAAGAGAHRLPVQAWRGQAGWLVDAPVSTLLVTVVLYAS